MADRPALSGCAPSEVSEGGGAPDISGTHRRQTYEELAAENEALRTLVKGTLLNVQGLVESAERVLLRASEASARLLPPPEDD